MKYLFMNVFGPRFVSNLGKTQLILLMMLFQSAVGENKNVKTELTGKIMDVVEKAQHQFFCDNHGIIFGFRILFESPKRLMFKTGL